jgi:sulfur-oxidizing protein SoxY
MPRTGAENVMRASRRTFLEGGLALLALLGFPAAARSGGWPEPAFEATAATEALERLFGSVRPVPSDDIDLGAPLMADDGSIVPISVQTALPGVRSISLVVESNPRPLAAQFQLAPGTLPRIACRIKMAETSRVLAVVQTDSGLFSASARIKITRGGCA